MTLFQEGQLSVTGEGKNTVLVNRLHSYLGIMWLTGPPDMTTAGYHGQQQPFLSF